MSAFQLDASGGVGPMPGWAKPVPECNRFIYWSDLSPFCQGYVEAMFADGIRDGYEATADFSTPRHILSARSSHLGFRHLAPATLSRIIADCEGLQKLTPPNWGESFAAGELAWKCRAGGWVGFRDEYPPLTPYLDDGLIYLREAGQ